MKSSENIEKEKLRIAESITPIYKVSENIKFNTISKIDQFFDNLTILDNQIEIETAQLILRNNGYLLSRENLSILQDRSVRLQLYNYLINIFNSTMSIGIYGNNFTRDEVRLSTNGTSRNLPLRRLFSLQETRDRIVNNIQTNNLKPVLEQITDYFLVDNIVIDTEKTQALINEAFQSIEPVLTEVLENEEIIRKNRRITEMDLKKLEAMYDYTDQFGNNGKNNFVLRTTLFSITGYAFLSMLLLLGGYIFFSQILKERFATITHTLTYLLLLLLTILFAFGITRLSNVHYIILPFALSVIIFALVFSTTSGMIFNSICLFLVLPFYKWNITVLTPLFIGTMLLLIIMTKMKDPHDFLTLSIACILSFIVVIISTSLITLNTDYINFLFYGSLSSIISITGVILLSPKIEKKLNLTNKMILLQLQETNNPLLRKMAIEAPGTYNHSLMVGNMAESAAEAIGANAVLAKVGGLYHDIGKLSQPDIFVENNSQAPVMHDKLKSYESTNLIRNHVPAGQTLARQYNLPQQVTDIIIQHHGDSKVSFFFEKAKKEGIEVDEKNYRYWGPKPRTKEAALVMIADIVESTAKSKIHSHTEKSLEEIIDSTIKRLINEGQLSEAPITLKELEITKNFMLPILVGVHQKRIEYPGESTETNPQ